MGMFGGSRTLSAAQQVARGGDGMDPSTVGQNRIFGDGSLGGILGGVGKILAYGPFVGTAQQGMNRQRVLEDNNMAYKSAMADHASDGPPAPDVIRSLIAAGIDPRSPQGQAIIANNYSHPIIAGSSETGFVPIGGQFSGGQPAAPPPPQVGQVIDGHRYNGGDPANPANWSAQ